MLKQALIERLIRLGATDLEDLPGVSKVVKSTPRLFMRKRSPAELAQLQHGVTGAFRKYEEPLERGLTKALSTSVGGRQLPGKVQKVLGAGGKMLINNPEQIPLQAVPIPGISPAILAGKKLLEKGIDRIAPAAF